MVLRSLGGCREVMLDLKVYFASMESIWVVLGGLGGRWGVMLDCRVNLAVQ